MTTTDPSLTTSQPAPAVTSSGSAPSSAGAVSGAASIDPNTVDVPPVPGLEQPAEGEGGRAVVDTLGEPSAEKTKLQKALDVANAIRAKGQAARRDRAARAAAEQQARELQQKLQRSEQEKAQLAWIANGNKPQEALDPNSPEAAQQRIAALEQRLADQEQANQQAALAAARQRFVQDANSNADDFPHVAAHLESMQVRVIQDAEAVVSYWLAKGEKPTQKDVLQYLEREYSKAAEKARSRPAKGNGGGAAAPSGANGGGQGSPGAKTLTSRTGERATLPVSFDDLSKEDQLVIMARQLKAAQSR